MIRMKKNGFIGLALFLILFSLVSQVNAEPRLYFNPAIVESNPGESPIIDLLIDGCNEGISGYAVMVSLDNPSIASLGEIITPPWATLNKIQKLNSSAVLIQGADTGRQIEPMEGGFPSEQLAKISVNAISAGYVTVRVTPIIIDNEKKGRYKPIVSSASIVISGAGPVPLKPKPVKP